MNKICLITNKDKDNNLEITNKVINYIKKHNKECILLKCYNGECDGLYTDVKTIPQDTDCIIVLGGDGTILQAAHDIASRDIPIFGINLGTLGFLAEIETQNIYQALDCLLSGQYTLENRMMLQGCIIRDGKKIYEGSVLNEIVVARSGFSRVISLSVSVNDELVYRYRGDGVLLSTPTGSTGYNLSAGGPVLRPNNKMIVLTPICPHSLNTRSIVLSGDDKVTVKVEKSKKTQDNEAITTFDGKESIMLHADDIIEIKKSNLETKLIRFYENNFFETLRTKIGYCEDEIWKYQDKVKLLS